jgi:N-methylhydantoinase B/oxoprolinase/acetone carboxylase alpha subunit
VTLDPIELQVLTGALRAACEEMGAALIHAAHSPNIKERHDCSTALFDARGQMVMQAEHIPVHLGSMPAAVAAVLGEDRVRHPAPVPPARTGKRQGGRSRSARIAWTGAALVARVKGAG